MSARKPRTTLICKTCDRPFTVHYYRQDTAQFCSKDCHYAYRLQRGFWECLDKSGGPDACWEWQGARQKNGYGVIRTNSGNKNIGAHRVVYAAMHGSIPPGLFVLHHCDNPPCCNPAHLFLGTIKDNALDARDKGRLRGMFQPGLPRHGTFNGCAKVTEDDVRYIRAMRGKVILKVLAKQFGITESTVCAIQLRRLWKHL